MVTCRRCGKQGWRYEMEITEGRWYCDECYSITERGEVPTSSRAQQDLREFMARRRAHLEFARYLARRGILTEELADGDSLTCYNRAA